MQELPKPWLFLLHTEWRLPITYVFFCCIVNLSVKATFHILLLFLVEQLLYVKELRLAT